MSKVSTNAKKFASLPGPKLNLERIKDPEVKRALQELERYILNLHKELSVVLV